MNTQTSLFPKLKLKKKETPICYSNVCEFSPEVVKQQIAMICREVSDKVLARSTVSVNTDEAGVNMTILASDFQCSIVVTESTQS